MSSHTGTHVDAPSHFIKGGKTIEEIPLNKFVDDCYVFEVNEPITKKLVNNSFNIIESLNLELLTSSITLRIGNGNKELNYRVLL